MHHFTLLFCLVLSWDFGMAFLRSGGLGDEIIFSQNIYMYSMCTNRYIILVWLFLCLGVLVLPFELLILSIFSHNQYFPILGTSTSSMAPPILSTKQMQRAVILEIRDLDIKKVLSQLYFFSRYFAEQKRKKSQSKTERFLKFIEIHWSK